MTRILLVEDDKISADITTRYLSGFCEVELAQDSEQAIIMAKNYQYPLILMDIRLEGSMSGINVFEEIRKLAGYKECPIAAVTAYAMESDKKAILDAGFDDYLSKPFNKTELYDLVSKYVKFIKPI